MKFLITILAVSSFVALAVFGFAAMAHGTGHGLCLATILGGKPPCPVQDPLGYVNFHANVFKKFSTAVFADALNIFAFSTMIVLAFVYTFLAYDGGSSQELVTRFLFEARILPEKLAKTRILNWLSFHEQSPNFSLGRG